VASYGSPDAVATHSLGPASRGASAGSSIVEVVEAPDSTGGLHPHTQWLSNCLSS
jgi:hypothetical protein